MTTPTLPTFQEFATAQLRSCAELVQRNTLDEQGCDLLETLLDTARDHVIDLTIRDLYATALRAPGLLGFTVKLAGILGERGSAPGAFTDAARMARQDGARAVLVQARHYIDPAVFVHHLIG